jgi:hypothetical protein
VLEVIRVFNLQSATTGFQALGLLKTLVIGTKNDGNIPNCSLQRIVDTHAKAATDIGDICIVIDATKESEAVND